MQSVWWFLSEEVADASQSLFAFERPKVCVQGVRSRRFPGYVKCEKCPTLISPKDFLEELFCCPQCHHHHYIPVQQRINSLVDEGSMQFAFMEFSSVDPLHFVDKVSYTQRLEKAAQNSYGKEALVTGFALIGGAPVAVGIMDFQFMAGSMGCVVGERLVSLVEGALKQELPLILFSASGGARMQESTLALMQMAKCSAALSQLHQAKLPFISVLTHPTMGGVFASFASQGDITIAEPGALIGFTGPRVIEQTMKKPLPEGAQSAECLLKHGLIDHIISRKSLREVIITLLSYLC